MDPKRRRARELAHAAIAAGTPTAWFEQLYREAAAGQATVPWVDGAPNPHLLHWLDRHGPAAGARVLEVGCGSGDNTAALIDRGYQVTAFDLSPTSLELAQARLAGRQAVLLEADLLSAPASWRRAFDLVVEIYTLQVLPPALRPAAARALAAAVAPGGVLLVIARGREPQQPRGDMPWPLTPIEIEALAVDGLTLEGMDDLLDDEEPPIRRLVAWLQRAQ